MQINFTQVLQDSWNFFRNQQKIMLQFVAILFIAQGASALLSFPVNDENKNDVLNLANTDITSFIFSVVITQILTSFIAAWGLTSIHKISLQNYRTLGETFSLTLRRFAGVILLDLLMVAPMLLSIGEAFAALLTKIALYYVTYRDDCWSLVLRPFKFDGSTLSFNSRYTFSNYPKNLDARKYSKRRIVYLHPTGLFSSTSSHFPIKRIFQ